jgi:hypothetical protein
MLRGRWSRWQLLPLAAVMAAAAGMPCAAQAATPASVPPPPPPPDDSFIEFLGADDVGDAGWWEFLKNSEPRAEEPSPPPLPQDGKK